MIDKKNNDDIKIKSQQIVEEIKNGEKQLEEIQNSCRHPHEEIYVKDIKPEAGSCQYRKVCGVCGKAVGYPSQEEIKNAVGGTGNPTE